MTLGLGIPFDLSPIRSRPQSAEQPIPSPVPYDPEKFDSEAHYLAYLAGHSQLNGRLPRLDYLRSQGVEIPDIMQFVPF